MGQLVDVDVKRGVMMMMIKGLDWSIRYFAIFSPDQSRVTGLCSVLIAAALCCCVPDCQAATDPSITTLQVIFGTGAASAISIGQLMTCLERGPIPLKVGDVSSFPMGRLVIRMENDLQQDELEFMRLKATARLTQIRQTNGRTLSAAMDLRHFADRACRQAKIQQGLAP